MTAGLQYLLLYITLYPPSVLASPDSAFSRISAVVGGPNQVISILLSKVHASRIFTFFEMYGVILRSQAAERKRKSPNRAALCGLFQHPLSAAPCRSFTDWPICAALCRLDSLHGEGISNSILLMSNTNLCSNLHAELGRTTGPRMHNLSML